MSLQPGIHTDIAAADYHRDPCPDPSLSHSIARLLVLRSAKHAWQAHPRLNPAHTSTIHTSEMQAGSALHAMVLGGAEELILPVDADDWRLKANQQIRENAIAAGKVPVLTRLLGPLQACAAACREALAEHEDCRGVLDRPFDTEATLIWREDTAWCRSRVDLLPRDPEDWVYDLKFTSASAAPNDFEKRIWQTHATQEAFYLRGLETLRGVRPRGMRFVACETDPPYGVTVFETANDVRAESEEVVDTAILLWAAAMESGNWRSYTRRVVHVEYPGWKLHQIETARTMQQVAARARPSMARVEAVRQVAERFGGPLS